MIKAAAPMTGGINCPPVEATDSIAPAILAGKPVLFISGIVNDPVVTTFPTVLPEIVAMIELDTTAAFAGPPTNLPVIEMASLVKNAAPPVDKRKAPKRINKVT